MSCLSLATKCRTYVQVPAHFNAQFSHHFIWSTKHASLIQILFWVYELWIVIELMASSRKMWSNHMFFSFQQLFGTTCGSKENTQRQPKSTTNKKSSFFVKNHGTRLRSGPACAPARGGTCDVARPRDLWPRGDSRTVFVDEKWTVF